MSYLEIVDGTTAALVYWQIWLFGAVCGAIISHVIHWMLEPNPEEKPEN